MTAAATRQQPAVFDLLDTCEQAITRRADAGWAAADAARAALAAARSGSAATAAQVGERISMLGRRCGLSAVDERLVQIAYAAETDPNVHLVLGLLTGDGGAGRPGVALALELAGLAPDAPEGRDRLAPDGPLSAAGVLEVTGAGAWPTRRLRLPDRVVAALDGHDRPPPELLSLLLTPVPMAVPAAHTLARALEQGEQLVWVQSPAGAAGCAAAAGACRMLGVPVLAVDLSKLPGAAGDGEWMPPVDAGPVALMAAREAALTGRVLLLVGAERAAGVLAELRRAPIPVLAVSAAPWSPAWAVDLPIAVRAERLTQAERNSLWAELLDGPVPAELATLRLSPEAMVEVLRLARREHQLAGSGAGTPSAAEIRGAAQRLSRGRHTRATGSVTLDELILPPHVHAEVAALLDWARYRDEVLAQGPLQGRGGKGTGICALFSGGPGTGKTLAAHAVADMLGMDLMQVDLSGVVSKYIGETEKNLERVFTEAETLHAVLFFDEADALFGSRSEVKDARDRYANQEVAYLLQRMEAFDGITVLATNLRGNLDPAFARRLHFVIGFPDPDPATRTRLWQQHLAPLEPLSSDVTAGLAELARLEVTGGEIRNMVLAAAFFAAAAGRPIRFTDLARAVVREFTKLGRRVPPGPWLS